MGANWPIDIGCLFLQGVTFLLADGLPVSPAAAFADALFGATAPCFESTEAGDLLAGCLAAPFAAFFLATPFPSAGAPFALCGLAGGLGAAGFCVGVEGLAEGAAFFVFAAGFASFGKVSSRNFFQGIASFATDRSAGVTWG